MLATIHVQQSLCSAVPKVLTAFCCLQNLAVDLLYYLPTVHKATARTCALVCLTDAFPLELALRVIDVLSSRPSEEDTSILLSFLVTVLLARVDNAQLSVNSPRHEALVTAVCRALPQIADSGTFCFSPYSESQLQQSKLQDGFGCEWLIVISDTCYQCVHGLAQCSCSGQALQSCLLPHKKYDAALQARLLKPFSRCLFSIAMHLLDC